MSSCDYFNNLGVAICTSFWPSNKLQVTIFGLVLCTSLWFGKKLHVTTWGRVIRTFLWPGICGERTGGDTWRSGRELPTEYSPHKSETNLSNQQQYNTSQEKTCQIRIQQLLIGLIITWRQHDIKKEFQPKTLSQIYTPPPLHFSDQPLI